MSIFPKKTIPGSTVTIHWNFNTTHLKDTHIFPLVRIGVIRPDGACTMLFEKNLLALPDILRLPGEPTTQAPRYLRKSTPLLVMADYLSGTHKKEVLVDILQNLVQGRHFYLPYVVPHDAPPGKYTLLSEVHNEGRIRHSKTATEDFFLVERITIKDTIHHAEGGQTTIVNHSPEPAKVKIVGYHAAITPVKTDMSIIELSPFEERTIHFSCPQTFILYNEERITIPVYNQQDVLVLRNQQWLTLHKKIADDMAIVYLLHNNSDEACTLTDNKKLIWDKADGLITRKALRTASMADCYDEMLEQGLIKEIAPI